MKAKTTQQFLTQKRIKITLLIITLYGVLLFVPLIAPFVRYPLYFVKCLGPPITASNFAAGSDYYIPGQKGYELTPFTTHFFCNEQEAQRYGFHKYEP